MSKEISPSSVFPPFIVRHWFVIVTAILMAIALFLRLDRLSVVPAGMTWDEAAIGYNGHAIVTTRRDEWLVRLPVSFKSFGDFKAPLAIYMSGIFTFVFGLNLWAVRLPFALAGVGSVLGVILLTKSFLEFYAPELAQRRVQVLSLMSGFLLTTSPWHFHFSRAGFEAGISLFFIIWGTLFLILFLQQKFKKPFLHFSILFFSSVNFVCSLYAYHSAKVFVPLFLLFVFVLHFKTFWKHRLPVMTATVVGLILLRPMIIDTLWGSGGDRFTQTSIFHSDSYWYSQLGIAFGNFWRHLSPQFLIWGQTTSLRHGDGHWGVLLITEALLLLIFLATILQKYLNRVPVSFKNQGLVFIVGWIILGIVPAAIGVEVPHSIRALIAYPGFLLASIVAVERLLSFISEKRLPHIKILGFHVSNDDVLNIFRSIVGMTLLLHSVLFLSYRHRYFSQFYQDSSTDFYYGYEQAMEYAKQYEDTADKILFTSSYGQPYIYALFARKTNPIWYQGGSLIKYEFTDRISEADLLRHNTLIIATPQQISPTKADDVVIAPNGEVKFVIITPKQLQP